MFKEISRKVFAAHRRTRKRRMICPVVDTAQMGTNVHTQPYAGNAHYLTAECIVVTCFENDVHAIIISIVENFSV